MQCLEGNTKYHRWYNSIISKRLGLKPIGYSETHHIKPKCLGGTDTKENLIELTAREHYMCHLLLVKMFEDNKFYVIKLLKAFVMMSQCTSRNQSRTSFNSKIYSNFKEKLSKFVSQQMKGEKNPQWNTTWIFNSELKINKKISATETIPEGWYPGRIFNWEKFFARIEKQKKLRERKQLKQIKALNFTRENKRVDLIKIQFTIECSGCGEIFETTNDRKVCCSTKCYNIFKYNQNLFINISKDNKTKQIKPVNYPAYKKYGWSRIDQNANP